MTALQSIAIMTRLGSSVIFQMLWLWLQQAVSASGHKNMFLKGNRDKFVQRVNSQFSNNQQVLLVVRAKGKCF